MEKLTSMLEKFLLPISERISSNKYLQAVASAFLALLPVTIVGSVAYLIANFPIQGLIDWLVATRLQNIILIPYHVSIGLMAVYSVFLIAYRLAEFEEIDPLPSGIIALICFFVVTPFAQSGVGPELVTTYSFQWLGASGLFVAIIVGLISTKINSIIIKKKLTIKMPAGVPPYVEKSFASIIPGIVIVAIFTVVAGCFTLTSFGSIHQCIFSFVQKPLMGLGSSFAAYLVATVLIQLLWWFGLHGFNIVGSIMIPIWMALDMQRLAQLEAGQAVTNYMGMSFLTAVGQSTIAVLLVVLLVAKSSQLREVAKIGMPAAIFNIGEPMVFGLPTVLNPILFIPTVLLIPIVTNVFMYIGFATGIVPPLTGAQIPMQMPVVLYGLVQGNWMLALWQLLAIPLAMVLIWPFIKMYDKQILKQSEKEIQYK